jgi:exodeoxyribonuclease V alpha subunit
LSVFGTIKKIKYLNELTDWAVIQFIDQDGGTFIAKGKMGPQYTGYKLNLYGKWEPNPKGGGQVYDVNGYDVMPPDTAEGMYLFLTSGLFKGMTKRIARALVDEYGVRTISLLDADINIVSTVQGVGPRTFIRIKNSYQESKPQQERILRLRDEYKFTFTESILVAKAFPEHTFKILELSPYSMYRRLNKIPFVRFDRIIMHHGWNPADPQRIQEVIQHQMKRCHKEGHTVMLYDEVMTATLQYLCLDKYLIENEMNYMISKRRLHHTESEHGIILQSMWLYTAEKEIANRLSIIINTPSEKQLIFDSKSPMLEKLKEHQARAIVAPFKHKVSIITGRPGAGKTTLLKTMLDMLESQNLSVLAVSPTGKAAQRLREVTKRDCSTIHRALKSTHQSDEFMFNDLNPLDFDVIVVDETSMLDTSLLRSLLRAVSFHARIILIGDVEQLPSVGAGATYRDLIDSGRFPVYWLTQVLRITKEDGSLPTPLIVANGIREGRFVQPPNDAEWAYHPTRSNDETKIAVKSVLEKLLTQGIGSNDVQILSPVINDEMGVDNMNKLVKRCFFPNGKDEIEVGDKIMQHENNYELDVFNGDIGVVKEFYADDGGIDDPIMLAEMSGRMIEYTKKDLYHVSLAYAITGHKSQGSEYPHVIIVIPDHHFSLMDRYWLYTLVTRCQIKAHLVGNEKVINQTIRSRRSHMRRTMLKSQLIKFMPLCEIVIK